MAIFFMITGYFQIHRKQISLLKIVLECFYYGILSVIVMVLTIVAGVDYHNTTLSHILSYSIVAVFTPTSGCWWFTASYLFMMLISPFINKVFLRFNKEGRNIILMIIWLLWYVIATTHGTLYSSLEKAVFFYSLGAVIRLNGEDDTYFNPKKYRYVYLIISILLWVIYSYLSFKQLCIKDDTGMTNELKYRVYGAVNTSLIVPICSVLIVKFFITLQIQNITINNIAKTTFGVYLIHDSLPGEELIWHNILHVDSIQFFSKIYPFLAIVSIAAVFTVCSMIDFVRIKIVEEKSVKSMEGLLLRFKERYSLRE